MPIEMLTLVDLEYQVLLEEYLESDKKNKEKKEKKNKEKKEKEEKKDGKKFLYASHSTEFVIEHRCLALLFQISHWEAPHIPVLIPPPDRFPVA